MTLTVWQHRAPLARLLAQLKKGRVTLGFIGGSITDARPRHNWPEPVTAWLVDAFPHVRFAVENAAIGATGSDLGVLRAQRDLIDRGCDIVFIDYAVNDEDTDTDRRMRSREGLLRKLLSTGRCDVVLAHTYSGKMYEAMMNGRQPDTVRELEELAAHYDVGSVWMGLYALDQVKRGLMRYEEWLPDGLHPTARGSYAYGESIIAYLKEELTRTAEAGTSSSANGLPAPMHPLHWGESASIPLDSAYVKPEGPWTLRRWPYYEWIDRVLETAAVGASLTVEFEGRGIALGFDFGRTSAEFRYRIDGGEWKEERRERPDWVGPDGWFRLSVLETGLAPGSHRLELTVTNGDHPGCSGTNFRLGLIGAIR